MTESVRVVTKGNDQEYPLTRMRDPKIAHEVLNRSGFNEVYLCVICVKHGDESCVHLGNEPAGPCRSFVLDERDMSAMCNKVMEMLLGNQT